ncbi:MAG: MinD/ParA family protein [Ignavibacteriales bacterium]|nr:MinD/ParA family protein [Ignavibacteriales bacterium]
MTSRRHVEVGRVRPHVVTITSGKGGVGKSTVALNLAITLSETGKNVLLLDADANLANLDVMLGISPKWRLNNVLRGELGIEDAVVSPYQRLKILAGSSGDPAYPQLDLEHQNRLMHDLVSTEEHFDLVVIDTAAGLSREIVNFAIHSDDVLVVTNVEPTSVMDAYAMMKIILAGNPGIPISFLMNAVRLAQCANEAAEKLQTALCHFLNAQASYIGFIPYDDNTLRAVVQQQPLVKLYPYSPAALSLRALARTFGAQVPSHTEARRLEPV